MRRWLMAGTLAALGATAWAHRPTTFDAAEIVTDATFSWTIPGDFVTGSEVFSFSIDYDAPFATPFEILVPTAQGNGSFRPHYVLVGPGLPAPDEAMLEAFPEDVELGEGDGVFYERNDREDRLLFWEGVMRRALVTSGTTAIAMEAGTYTIWIWSPEEETGNFLFGFGVEENFEDGGFGGVFSNWSDFAY